MVTDPLGDEKEKETVEMSLEASIISEEEKEEDDEQDDDDDSEWQEALANTGKVYYWNVKTRETRWEKPTSKVA